MASFDPNDALARMIGERMSFTCGCWRITYDDFTQKYGFSEMSYVHTTIDFPVCPLSAEIGIMVEVMGLPRHELEDPLALFCGFHRCPSPGGGFPTIFFHHGCLEAVASFGQMLGFVQDEEADREKDQPRNMGSWRFGRMSDPEVLHALALRLKVQLRDKCARRLGAAFPRDDQMPEEWLQGLKERLGIPTKEAPKVLSGCDLHRFIERAPKKTAKDGPQEPEITEPFCLVRRREGISVPAS